VLSLCFCSSESDVAFHLIDLQMYLRHELKLEPAAAEVARAQPAPKATTGLSATALAQAQGIGGIHHARSSHASNAPHATAGGTPLVGSDGSALVWRRAAGGLEGQPGGSAAAFAAVRSTVTFNERFGQLTASDLSPIALRSDISGRGQAGIAIGNGAGAGALAGTDAVAAGGEAVMATGGASGSDASGADHGNDPQASDNGTPGADGSGNAEGEDTAISHWGTQNLRHASLRVGQEGQEAIDIQLSVKGQEVQVDFRTDDAHARQTLENSADETLAELLQRSGIQLAGVSVGSQGAQGREASQGDQSKSTVARGQRAADRLGGEAAPAATARPLPPRTDGSQPLDLFV
jgi:hypothetical protein